jgi:hypothetical protein
VRDQVDLLQPEDSVGRVNRPADQFGDRHARPVGLGLQERVLLIAERDLDAVRDEVEVTGGNRTRKLSFGTKVDVLVHNRI